MGVPVKVEAFDNSPAEALLGSLDGMAAAERRKHASMFNYWLSIKGERQFPAIRDLDPLEISDAGPWSVLLEMIGAGENAVIRHFGQAIKLGEDAETIARAAEGSLLARIHARLPEVAGSMQAMAFEDSFDTKDGPARCWVTLLPFSASGTWIDYVYGIVSLDAGDGDPEMGAPQPVEDFQPDEVAQGPIDQVADAGNDGAASTAAFGDSDVPEPPPEEQPDSQIEPAPLPELDHDLATESAEAGLEPLAPFDPEPVEEAAIEADAEIPGEPELDDEEAVDELVLGEEDRPTKAGFSSKFLESLAHVGGFYGRVAQAPEPVLTEELSQPDAQPEEATLQSKLSDVRAMAEEARMAQIRSNQALCAGLSAAYDFALDAEAEPEEYLRLVEGQGLKIQLRSPMKPVVKLAFAETCDDATIGQLEAVLSWALKNDLPRGSLAERIEAEGGLGAVLEGLAKAA